MLHRRDWPAESLRMRWAVEGTRLTRWKSPEIGSNKLDLCRETDKTNVDLAGIRKAVVSKQAPVKSDTYSLTRPGSHNRTLGGREGWEAVQRGSEQGL